MAHWSDPLSSAVREAVFPGQKVGGDLFVLLDAAKIMHLPEILANSGLQHKCLFQNDAEDELGQVGPWLVRLKADHFLMQNLFTPGDANWQLWDKEVGFFIRSDAGFDAVWQHLRKFTRVQDRDDAWFYLRFWEPDYAAAYFSAISADHNRTSHWFWLRDGAALSFICVSSRRQKAAVFTADAGQLSAANVPFRLGALEQRVFTSVKFKRFALHLGQHLENEHPAFAAMNEEARLEKVNVLIHEAYRANLTIEKAVADYSEARILHGRPLDEDPILKKILTSSRHPLDRAALVLAQVRGRMLPASGR